MLTEIIHIILICSTVIGGMTGFVLDLHFERPSTIKELALSFLIGFLWTFVGFVLGLFISGFTIIIYAIAR